MGSRFDAGDRHSDDLIAAVDHAARSISHALAEGFGLIARQITASTPGPDNSAQIEATVENIKILIDNLHKSIPKP